MYNNFVIKIVAKKKFGHRYVARAILVPFAYQAPAVSVDNLDRILTRAPAAIPQAIKVEYLAVYSLTLGAHAQRGLL